MEDQVSKVNLGRKLRTKLRSLLNETLVKVSVFLQSPALSARVFAWLAGEFNASGEYTVLCLGRSIFMEDINALATFGKRLKFVVIHLNYFEILFNHFTKPEERRLLTEGNYHTAGYCSDGKLRYRTYLEQMWPTLRRYLPFNAVLTGNIGYIVQQELAVVCEKARVPFVILHKEAVVVSDAYENFLEHYRTCKFVGAAMLFYNAKCQRGFVSLSVPGLTMEKTRLIGIPRFDFYFLSEKQRVLPEPSKQLVFFSFLPRTSTRFLTKSEEKLQAIERRTEEFYQAVMNFAAKHSDWRVVIKTKFAPQYLNFAHNSLVKNFPNGLPNLVIINTESPSELIYNSRGVAGFNSTTLIEAIIAEKPVFSPFFGDIFGEEPWSFFQRHPQLVNYVRTSGDLEKHLLGSDFSGHEPSLKKNFLEEFISTATGGASQKAESTIIEAIESYRKLT